MVTLVVGRWTPFVRGKKVSRKPWIIAEGSPTAVKGVRPGQGIVCVQRKVMGQSLAVAEVHAVIVRPSNRLFVANACQFRDTGIRRKIGIERTEAAFSIYWYFLVDVDGFILVQAENVCVFGFDDR